MKKILITGKNSYIGNSFVNYCQQNNADFEIDVISVRGDGWKKQDFSKYDVLFHVAGVAHRRETKENRHLYYKVNRDLAIEIAQKAKNEGIKQFIFMSTMSVYGLTEGYIDKNTVPNPKNSYGQSKLEAEKSIQSLYSNGFITTIIRPPMVYGKNCKGNYQLLSSLAKKTPIFPYIENKRSMIYIDNLSEFVKQIISNEDEGLFFPQNNEYIRTSKMIKSISEVNGKKLIMIRGLDRLFRNINIKIINKVFGDLVYKQSMSRYKNDYNIYSVKESIALTETI